ncbi:MAG TPA: phosphoribosylglycinamide formyltransferase [Bacteroidales bacterium]|nr:phosphoribosylglycinamide formyltransferase [Bacteroidales bacterium]
MKNIAILASGSGSNAENIAGYFADSERARVRLIVSDRENAGVLKRAKCLNIEGHHVSRKSMRESNQLMILLHDAKIDLIVLAGFLALIPSDLIQAFDKRIINIHPALLPAYGGKGMYGDKVHQAVIENNETESGISIHYVNEKYDEGRLILQARCPVLPGDDVSSLANRIHKLEYRYYPQVIDQLIEMDLV